MMSKMRARFRTKKVHSVTWSCPRCGRPFETEVLMTIHYLQCGR